METFGYPRAWVAGVRRALVIIAGLLAAALVVPFVAAGSLRRPWLFAILFWPGLGYVLAVLLSIRPALDDRVTVDDDGLEFIRPGRPPQRVRWQQIASVKVRDCLGRFDLRDADELTLGRLEYQVEDFDRLREIVASRLPSGDVRLRRRLFRADLRAWGILFLPAVLFAWLAISKALDAQIGQAFAGFALLAAVIVAILTHATRVDITDEGVQIRYPVYRRFLAFGEIRDVAFGDGSRRPSGAVYVHRARGRPIELPGVVAGSTVLYEAVRRAWEQHRPPR